MESWRLVFRDGFAPILPTAGLEAAATALREDDPRLIQSYISRPMGRLGTLDDPVEGACLVGMCGWRGEGLTTVDEVEKFFSQACWDADQRLGERAACRHFLDWFDGTPRAKMRRELLAEVDRELALRRQCEPDSDSDSDSDDSDLDDDESAAIPLELADEDLRLIPTIDADYDD